MSVALLAGCVATPAFAGVIMCEGTVAELTYTLEGGAVDPIVLLKLSSMNAPVKVCSLSQDWPVAGFTTTPAGCKALYSAMLAARLSGITVREVYIDFTGTLPTTCMEWATTPTFQQVSVRNYRL